MELFVRELGDPVLAGADDVLGDRPLALDHLVDALLERAVAYELVDLHLAVLTDAEGPVRRLVLDGGIPPAVEVEDVVGGREVEAHPAGLQ